MTPRVSVIIPVHNRLQFLQEAVQSVRAQSYRDFELIIVDDCSDDGTREWIREQNDLQLIALNERAFPSRSRNLGARQAQGELLAFLDSDDMWKPDKLVSQVAFFDAHPDIGICHTEEEWIRRGKRVNQRQRHKKCGGRIFNRCLDLCLISPSAVMFRRELYWNYGGFDPAREVGEDYHLWLLITAREEIGFLPEALTVKRGGHDDQLSARYGQIEIFRIAALEDVLARDWLDTGQHEAATAVLARKCRVYGKGCIKHGRPEEGEKYLARADELAS